MNLTRRQFFAMLLTPLIYVARPRPDVWAVIDEIMEREGHRVGLTDLVYGRNVNVLMVRNVSGHTLKPGRLVKWNKDVEPV